MTLRKKIKYGDTVTLRIDSDDISFNGSSQEMPNGEHHLFGTIDYVVIE